MFSSRFGLGVLVGSAVLLMTMMAVRSSSKNVIRVNELILENDKGEVVGLLSTFSNGSPYLYLSNGESDASIYVEDKSSAGVVTQTNGNVAGIGSGTLMPFVKVSGDDESVLMTSFVSPLVGRPDLGDSYTHLRVLRGGSYRFFPTNISRSDMRDLLMADPKLLNTKVKNEWATRMSTVR